MLCSRVLLLFRPYPELFLLIGSLTVLLIGYFLGLPVIPPNVSSVGMLLHYYLAMLIVAIALNLLFVIVPGPRRRPSGVFLGLSIPTLIVVAFCHFQFKAWMPLINPHRFGPTYERIDQLLSPVVDCCDEIQRLIIQVGARPSAAYHGLFFLLFFVAFSLHAFFDSVTGQRQVAFGVGLILALGGFCYWIAPAIGPFIFRSGISARATVVEQHMFHQMNLLVATGRIPPAYFGMAPAAMPSLHVAHTLFLILMMRRISRWLTIAFMPFFVWICTASVALAWHFIVDIPAGMALAWVAVFVVSRALPDSQPSGPALLMAKTAIPTQLVGVSD